MNNTLSPSADHARPANHSRLTPIPPTTRAILIPLILSASIIIVDQITKMLIVLLVERYYESGYAISVIGDFLRIIHVSNTAIAFSIGRGLPEMAKRILFIVLPSMLMVMIIWYYIRAHIPTAQRWALASMIGGGIGNIIDRIFRPQGVIDFIDVKFYGIFGFNRWPTFNVADSAIVVGAITLIITTLFMKPLPAPETPPTEPSTTKPPHPSDSKTRSNNKQQQ